MTMVFIGENDDPRIIEKIMRNVSFKAFTIRVQRNLIYTGITRAKKILVLVGTRKALSYAVRNVTVSKRNTMLKERLSGGKVILKH